MWCKQANFVDPNSVDLYLEGKFTVGTQRVIRCYISGQVAYLAIKEQTTGYTFALVVQLRFCPRGLRNLSILATPEQEGPQPCYCPYFILNLLSPINPNIDKEGKAFEWRKRCKNYNNLRRHLSFNLSKNLSFIRA